MATGNSRTSISLPEPSLRRLPWYLAYVKLLRDKGVEYVSSTQISKEINVDASQIAKDLSFINISGKTRVGYEVGSLVDALEKFLGFGEKHKAVIFGVGSLGAALLQDSGLAQYGMNVIAGFDVDKAIINTRINGIPVYDVADFPRVQQELDACIGILTVPVDRAQEACNDMIAGGVRAEHIDLCASGSDVQSFESYVGKITCCPCRRFFRYRICSKNPLYENFCRGVELPQSQ